MHGWEAADVLHRVFQWCYPRNGKTDVADGSGAARRSGVWNLPRMFSTARHSGEMATELGRTNGALSKTNVHAERHFGIHFPRSTL